eukprot:TRINITY_DN11998_c1_g2_i2.p1 TRINITY_DN11998_c1_g2~~TRINITY_DN11998_c1_g2_i2.p1  ORF type:complete len:492 (+),score=79.68 TRINITY_DN11998_c1_g2_i2:220-1476(+)
MEIHIPDCTQDSFQVMLNHCYFLEYEINKDNVLEVLFAAKKYLLKELEAECRDWLDTNMQIDTAVLLWTQAQLLPDEQLANQSLRHLLANGMQLFTSQESLVQVPRELFWKILSSDMLVVDNELTCFEALIEWAKHQCSSSDIGDIRSCIQDLLPLVGLPLLTIEQLHVVASSGIVTAEHIGLLFVDIGAKRVNNTLGYRSTLRHPYVTAQAYLYGRDGVAQDWRKGVDMMRQLSDAGDHYAMAFYAECLWSGKGVKVDPERAKQLWGASQHPFGRFCQTLNGIGVAQNHDIAFRILSTECDQTDPMVSCMMGACKSHGYGCLVDKSSAADYYRQAGLHLSALNNLGMLHNRGVGVVRNKQKAFELYEQAATQGYAQAMYNLGFLYKTDKKDSETAKQWFSKAAELGHGKAIEALKSC